MSLPPLGDSGVRLHVVRGRARSSDEGTSDAIALLRCFSTCRGGVGEWRGSFGNSKDDDKQLMQGTMSSVAGTNGVPHRLK